MVTSRPFAARASPHGPQDSAWVGIAYCPGHAAGKVLHVGVQVVEHSLASTGRLSMAHAKQPSKNKRRKTALPALGAAGVSFTMVGGAPANTLPATDGPSHGMAPIYVLGEEEISDISLATFYVFDRQSEAQDERVQLAQRGCRGCRGCAARACRGCGGGCAVRACRGCRGCGGCGVGWGAVGLGAVGLGLAACAGCGGGCGPCWSWTSWGWVRVC